MNTPLLIAKSLKKTVRSEKKTLYVLVKGVDLDGLGGKGKVLEVATEGALANGGAIQSSEVVLVDESGLEFFKAVSLIVGKVLGS